MRMEELNNNNYIKGTDSVERYLLNLIKEYFNASGIADDNSQEYIIQKAVKRMKEELYIDNAGVVSINGQTGEVNITLEDLGGEPKISPKKTAFNVDFGSTNGTACEGNDKRLNDKRIPLSHSHSINDINGLAGELNSIINSINLLDNKTHKHNNKDVLDKLIYTGINSSIDLTILDTAESIILSKTSEVTDTLLRMNNEFDSLTQQIENTLQLYQTDYDTTIANIQVKGNEVTSAIESYCETALQNKTTLINENLSNKITKEQFNSLIQITNQGFSTIYEETFSDIITGEDIISITRVLLPEALTQTLNGLGNQYEIDFKLEYIDPLLSKQVKTIIPFLYAANGQIQYTLSAAIENNSEIVITGQRFVDTWNSFIDNASITFRIKALNNIPEVI